jgi:tetratricopeptide (TPR) repeat protein
VSGQRDTLMMRGIPQAVFLGLLGFMVTALMQVGGLVPGGAHVPLIGGGVGAFIGWGITRLLLSSGERVATSIYAPAGKTTAYTPTFSHIETLEVRGDFDGAARAWDETIAEHPTNALVRVRAADFHLRRRGDAARAVEFYRAARDLGTANDELRRYIGQKLADVYLGPLNDEGRAMGELRRLIDMFPDSREAQSAREALAAIKAARS